MLLRIAKDGKVNTKATIAALKVIAFVWSFVRLYGCLKDDGKLSYYSFGIALVIACVNVASYSVISPAVFYYASKKFKSSFLGAASASLLLLIALTCLMSVTNTFLGSYIGFTVRYFPTIIYYLKMHLFICIFIGTLIVTIRELEYDKKYAELGKQQEYIARVKAESDANLAKISLLKMQLSPHVILNILNGIMQLYKTNYDKAESTMKSLNTLLRDILYASDKLNYNLTDEFKIIERYLDLEKMRLGDRLEVKWDWDDSIDYIHIPPLVIYTLIENAVKHGIAPCVGGGKITVILAKHKCGIRMAVHNTGNTIVNLSSNGVGIKNLQSRLMGVFGNDALFSICSKDDQVIAEVVLKMELTQPDLSVQSDKLGLATVGAII